MQSQYQTFKTICFVSYTIVLLAVLVLAFYVMQNIVQFCISNLSIHLVSSYK